MTSANANETMEIGRYMNAAYNAREGTRPVRQSILNIDPLVTPSGKVVSKRLSVAMNRAMDEKVTPMKGQRTQFGKGHPNAKKFSIRIRNPMERKAAEVANNAGQLDPEGLKDAVLQQAMLQRRALVNKSLRQGTGRSVQRAKFELNVVVRTPVQPSPQPALDFAEAANQTSTQQAGAEGDLSPFNFSGRARNVALSPMEGVPERLEFVAAGEQKKRGGSGQLMPPPPPLHRADDNHDGGNTKDNNDFDFGYDDYGGDDYGWIDDDPPHSSDFLSNDPLPGREAGNPDGVIAPKRKRIVMNPGSRLRGELRRKSLANDANVGLQEVAPGLRRSTRRSQEPLKWWLNEKKVMSRRKYKAMPTVAAVITDPNPASPWRMVEDPNGARQNKSKVKGPPKKKGPKKGVRQVMKTEEATARTPIKGGGRGDDNRGDVADNLADNLLADEECANSDALDEGVHNDELTEDEDTLMIGDAAANTDNQSDVTVPLDATRKSKIKATPTGRASTKSRKSTKSMGTIPEDDVASPSSDDSFEEDEIIIGRASRGSKGSRGSSAHAAQSETLGEEATLNMQPEPSTATTVDQGGDIDEENQDNEEQVDDAEDADAENANTNKKRSRPSSVSGSPSKEPTRRSTRNRATTSSN